VPYVHKYLKKWETALHFGAANHFNAVHEETNIMLGGGLDDVWHNRETGELHIVDYKSTAQGVNGPTKQPSPITLEGRWKAAYKRQMDMYQWVMRGMGYRVNDTGYFVYVDGQHWAIGGMLDENPTTATMKFSVSLLSYEGDTAWVEETLREIKGVLTGKRCPHHSDACEQGVFLTGVGEALNAQA